MDIRPRDSSNVYKYENIEFIKGTGFLRVGNEYYEIELYSGDYKLDPTKVKEYLNDLFRHTKGVFKGVNLEFQTLDDTIIKQEGIQQKGTRTAALNSTKSMKHYHGIEEIVRKILGRSVEQKMEEKIVLSENTAVREIKPEEIEELNSFDLYDYSCQALKRLYETDNELSESLKEASKTALTCPNIKKQVQGAIVSLKETQRIVQSSIADLEESLGHYQPESATEEEIDILDKQLEKAVDILEVFEPATSFPTHLSAAYQKTVDRLNLITHPEKRNKLLQESKEIQTTKDLNDFEGKLQKVIRLQDLYNKVSEALDKKYPNDIDWERPEAMGLALYFQKDIHERFEVDEKVWNNKLKIEINDYESRLDDIIERFLSDVGFSYQELINKAKANALEHIRQQYSYMDENNLRPFQEKVLNDIDENLNVSFEELGHEEVIDLLSRSNLYLDHLEDRVETIYVQLLNEILNVEYEEGFQVLEQLKEGNNHFYAATADCIKKELSDEADEIEEQIYSKELEGRDAWDRLGEFAIAVDLQSRVSEYLPFIYISLEAAQKQIENKFSALPVDFRDTLLIDTLQGFAKKHAMNPSSMLSPTGKIDILIEERVAEEIESAFKALIEKQLSNTMRILDEIKREKDQELQAEDVEPFVRAYEKFKWKMEEDFLEKVNLEEPEKALYAATGFTSTWTEERIRERLNQLFDEEKKDIPVFEVAKSLVSTEFTKDSEEEVRLTAFDISRVVDLALESVAKQAFKPHTLINEPATVDIESVASTKMPITKIKHTMSIVVPKKSPAPNTVIKSVPDANKAPTSLNDAANKVAEALKDLFQF